MYMNVIVTDIVSYFIVDVAMATLQSTHFICHFEVFFVMITTSNFHVSQTLSCISKFFLQLILYFIGLNCHYIYECDRHRYIKLLLCYG